MTYKTVMVGMALGEPTTRRWKLPHNWRSVSARR